MLEEKISKLGQLVINIVNLNFIRKRKTKNNEKESNQETLTEILNSKDETKRNPEIKKSHIIIITLILSLLLVTKNIMLIEISIIIITIKIIHILLPKIKEDKRQKEVIRELPYALRQISIELKAGIGLFDAMKSISESDYGELSNEFKITLEEIHYGSNYNQAFDNLIKRNNEAIMKKTINQIKRTLNTGGNLADTLNSIADESMINLKLKYKEYSEKLNSIMLLYMFIAVLIPVILYIMIIAATTIIGPVINEQLLIILYLFFFPFVISFIIIFIKRLEPSL